MAKVLFYTATSEQFSNLAEKDENALYFITDTGEICKGGTKYSFPVRMVEEFPDDPETGPIYINGSGEARVWNGGEYVTLGDHRLDNFLTGAQYYEVLPEEAGSGIYTMNEAGDKGILLSLNSGEDIFVCLNEFWNVYVPGETGGKGVELTIGDNELSAEIKVSASDGNQVVLNDDGVYVAPLAWQSI